MNWDFVRRKVQSLRDRKGWSDNVLSEKSGVPQPTISRFLNETTDWMYLDNLWAIARALDASVGELIGEQAFDPDEQTRRVLKAMQDMPDYKKDVVVSTAETLSGDGGKKSA